MILKKKIQIEFRHSDLQRFSLQKFRLFVMSYANQINILSKCENHQHFTARCHQTEREKSTIKCPSLWDISPLLIHISFEQDVIHSLSGQSSAEFTTAPTLCRLWESRLAFDSKITYVKLDESFKFKL